jgi:hypothetical protein
MHTLSCPAFEPLRLERFWRAFPLVITPSWWRGANENDNGSRVARERFDEGEGSASANEIVVCGAQPILRSRSHAGG